MTTSYILAPNSRWQGRDNTGQPCVGGSLYTYVNQTLTPKTTYQDSSGVTPNTNPIILDGKGEANIYWATDQLYTIKLYTSGGQLVSTQDNYPNTGFTDVSPVVNLPSYNFVRNPQFSAWSNGTTFNGITTTTNVNYDCTADDWYFSTDVTNPTVNITQQFSSSVTPTLPGNPPYFLRYELQAAGTGGNYIQIGQAFKNARALAGQVVSASIQLYGTSSSPIVVTVNLTQHFGTGGSPSAPFTTNLITTTDLTSSFALYTGSNITIPSIAGKTFGTNGDDYISIDINFPVGQLATIGVGNVQLQTGDTVTNFVVNSIDDQYRGTNYQTANSIAKTGDFKLTLRNVADYGWLMCDDGTIGNLASNATHKGTFTQALYTLLWNNITNTAYVPIFNSDGTVGTRGATANADYIANKRLSLTKALGRILAGANPSAVGFSKYLVSVTNSGGNLLLTVDDTSCYTTGMAVQFTLGSGGAFPGNITASTNFYLKVVSSTTLYVSTNTANLNASSYVQFLSTGTLPIIMTTQVNTHNLGSFTGEDTHLLSGSELAAHAHFPVLGGSFITNHTGSDAASGGTGWQKSDSTTNTGGDTPHNIMQPTTYVNVMIKL